MTYKKITEPINFYVLDEFIPLTMHADGLMEENDSYSIMEVDCEFGHANFINLNPAVVDMMDMHEIRKLILDALDAYMDGENFSSKEEALDHYVAQSSVVEQRARQTTNNQC